MCVALVSQQIAGTICKITVKIRIKSDLWIACNFVGLSKDL